MVVYVLLIETFIYQLDDWKISFDQWVKYRIHFHVGMPGDVQDSSLLLLSILYRVYFKDY